MYLNLQPGGKSACPCFMARMAHWGLGWGEGANTDHVARGHTTVDMCSLKLHPCISGFSARVSIVSLVSKLIDEDMYEHTHPIHLNTKLYASNISRLAGM